MDERIPGAPFSSTPPSGAPSAPERVMRVTPLDMRQQRFKKALNGFDRTEVVAFLTEAADDFEAALRENDRLRQELRHFESLLKEHRDREATLRNTLLTAQKLSDQVRETAEAEANMIVREAQGRADLLLQKAQARLEDIEREINDMKLRRRGVEGTLESAIQTLYHALEAIRDDRPEDKVLLHRPRQADHAQGGQVRPGEHGATAADSRG